MFLFNKAKFENLRKAVAKQRAEEARYRANNPTIEDLYTMPMEDLRRLGASHSQVLSEEMRINAEEGGW
jgi:hypothetical protein